MEILLGDNYHMPLEYSQEKNALRIIVSKNVCSWKFINKHSVTETKQKQIHSVNNFYVYASSF